MKICKHCKHWKKWEDYPNRGSCDLLDVEYPKGAAVAVYSDSLPLGTDPKFGCVHWAAFESDLLDRIRRARDLWLMDQSDYHAENPTDMVLGPAEYAELTRVGDKLCTFGGRELVPDGGGCPVVMGMRVHQQSTPGVRVGRLIGDDLTPLV